MTCVPVQYTTITNNKFHFCQTTRTCTPGYTVHSHTHSTLFTSTNLADPKTITRGTTVCKSMQCLLQTKYAGSLNLKRQRRKMIMFPAVSLRNEECSCCCHNPSPLRPIESQWQATRRTPCIQPTTPTLCNHLLALVHDGCKNKRGP